MIISSCFNDIDEFKDLYLASMFPYSFICSCSITFPESSMTWIICKEFEVNISKGLLAGTVLVHHSSVERLYCYAADEMLRTSHHQSFTSLPAFFQGK